MRASDSLNGPEFFTCTRVPRPCILSKRACVKRQDARIKVQETVYKWGHIHRYAECDGCEVGEDNRRWVMG